MRLRGLERLDLSGNWVSNAGPLADLPHLTVLLLDRNPVSAPRDTLGELKGLGWVWFDTEMMAVFQ